MIYNCDCIKGSKKYLFDNSIDLIICDPPFGIQEKTFDKHYNRNEKKVIKGYREAPSDYYRFSYKWIEQAKRILKDNGSMYIISGWSNFDLIGRSLRKLNLYIKNKIIWKFNFGVATTRKFVTSHYEIFYITKFKKSKITFNTNCRFGSQEKDSNGNSMRYKDLESVWYINKEYHPNKEKNKNKLPEKLISKMIMYSSNENDTVCDFFLGNFTTAIVSKKLNRIPYGFEINSNNFDNYIKKLENTKKGCDLISTKDEKPFFQGKKITIDFAKQICNDYQDLRKKDFCLTKKKSIEILGKKYGRGIFSIEKILKKYGSGIISVKNIKEEEIDLLE